MGIKDLFGGGKKKAAFREKAKETLSEGRIVPGKADALAKLSVRSTRIEDPADDKTMLRREIYNKAVGNVKGRGKLTEVESSELAKIQKFLALRDDQVEQTIAGTLRKAAPAHRDPAGQASRSCASNNAALRGVRS